MGKREERFVVEVPEGSDKKDVRSVLREKAGELVECNPYIKQAGSVRAAIRPVKQVVKGKGMGKGLEM